MRKIFSFQLILFLIINLQAQESIDNLGILSLSDGRYDELHEFSHYERVGSALIDMNTMKIISFIDKKNADKKTEQINIDVTRFLTIDPLAEKYSQMSPYGYCANNPIRYIDPDGQKLVDANGNIMYTHSGGWSENASAGARRIGNAMMNTPTGREQFNKLSAADYNVTLTLGGSNGSKLGDAYTTTVNGKISQVDITVYGDRVSSFMDKVSNAQEKIAEGGNLVNATEKQEAYIDNANSIDDVIGAVGSHEAEHATNLDANGAFEPDKDKREGLAEKKEIEYLKELPEHRIEKMESISPQIK